MMSVNVILVGQVIIAVIANQDGLAKIAVFQCVMEKLQRIQQYVQVMVNVFQEIYVNVVVHGQDQNAIYHHVLDMLQMTHKLVMVMDIVLV